MKSKIHFMDEETKVIFTDPKNTEAIYRYIPLKHLDKNSLYFANPGTWPDPFEKLFLKSKYKIDKKQVPYKYENSIFCMCVTTTKYSEATWKVYGSEVQFKISKELFLSILEANTDKYDIYIGKVEYRNSSDLLRNSPLTLLGLEKKDFQIPEGWIRLLLQKRNDFKYENEIRIILIKKGLSEKKSKKGIQIVYNEDITSLFPKAIISPTLSAAETESVKKELEKYFFSPENIHVNKLYKEVEPRNINLDYVRKK